MSRNFKVQIMGAGAIGSLFGALIQLSGYDVHFVARGDQLEALSKNGLMMTGLLERKIDIDASNEPEDADITIVAVKAYDTENAAKQLSTVDCGVVCTIQNGIGNRERLSKYLDKVLGGTTTYGANVIKPGVINFAGRGITYVGEDGHISEEALMIEEVLKSSGIECKAVSDISLKIWQKAVINAAINPLTAICQIRNGKIIEIPELWIIAEKIVEEGERVMSKLGMEVSNLSEIVREVALKTANNRSSMLQDIQRGKKTEIDYINGEIARKAEEVGVDATFNRILTLLVKGVEKANGIDQ
jgi:2-dehydropantoate 2-reductase